MSKKGSEVTGAGPINPSRREFIKKTCTAAAIAVAAPTVLSRYAHAAARPVKLGFVSPKTGPLAVFGEPDDFALRGIRKALANGLMINGTNHPVLILNRDSRSDPNRAAEVTSALIKADQVDIVLTGGHLDTVNPVADQAEVNGVPCITDDAPWEPYFFGRGGKPDKGFEWTYHFFWGMGDDVKVCMNLWKGVPTNKVVGALWPNDAAGNAFAQAYPPAMKAAGYKIVDSGRFQGNTNDYSAQISLFKQENVEVLTGVMVPPAFATFWSQAAQQGFKPKVALVSAATSFPEGVEALGDRAIGLASEVNWSPAHPFKSGLTGQSCAEYAAQWEKETGKQWSMVLGFKHALFEVAIDVLKRTKNIDSRQSVLEAIRATNYNSIAGHVQWTGIPVKNVSTTPLVGGQWVRGKKHKYDLVIVNNETAPFIKTQAKMFSL